MFMMFGFVDTTKVRVSKTYKYDTYHRNHLNFVRPFRGLVCPHTKWHQGVVSSSRPITTWLLRRGGPRGSASHRPARHPPPSSPLCSSTYEGPNDEHSDRHDGDERDVHEQQRHPLRHKSGNDP